MASASTVCRLNQKIYRHTESLRKPCDRGRVSVTNLRAMKLPKAAEFVETKAHETITYYAFPSNPAAAADEQST
jgi:hypothetical protein